MTKAIDYYKRKIEGFEEMSFEERRYQLEYLCLDKDKMHTKATLKALFRLKPSPNAKPCGNYKNDYKQIIDLYYPIDCVAMRNVSKKPRTEAQKQATRKLVAETFNNSPKGRAIELCKSLITHKAAIIDTETTDLDGVAIQIAVVCCATKEVLYSSLIATDKPISQDAYEVHGIDAGMLEDAPSADDVAKNLTRVLGDRTIVAFNSSFDKAICRTTFSEQSWFSNFTVCAMRDIAVPILGATNRYNSISLSDAMCFAGVKWRGNAHDASADCLAVADLISEFSSLA